MNDNAAQFDDVEEPIATQMVATGLFGPITVRRHTWEQEYDATSYIQLLNTYSGHLALPPSVRTRLLDGIGDLINGRFQGHVRKGYLSLLYVAQKR